MKKRLVWVTSATVRATDCYSAKAVLKDDEVEVTIKFLRRIKGVVAIPIDDYPTHRYDQLNYLMNVFDAFEDGHDSVVPRHTLFIQDLRRKGPTMTVGVVEPYCERVCEGIQKAIDEVLKRPEGFSDCDWLYERRETKARRIR